MQPKVSQTFSDDDLILLSEGIEETLTKRRELLERFVNRKYRNAKSEEFANHGFCRRIGIMVKCIENIFEILPPNSTYVPEKENVDYAIINLQAFVNNVFGCCDNLAWIWVLENSIRSKNGNNPSPRSVGLRTKLLMENYPEALVEYINGIKPWLEYIKGYRDALCHRIPLYVPPYFVDPKNAEKYHELENESFAELKNENLDRYHKLESEKKELMFFRPIMTHSLVEEPRFVVFHSQVIADFNTIHEIATKFLEQLESGDLI